MRMPPSVLARVIREPVGRLRDIIHLQDTPHLPSELDTLVEKVTLISPTASITIVVYTLGATVTSIKLDKGEECAFVDDEPNWMAKPEGYYGRSCGRLSGRTGPYSVAGIADEDDIVHKSTFDETDMAQRLHGGHVGFAFRNWTLVNTFCSQRSARAVFELDSEHLDQGHPGALKVECHIMAVDNADRPRFDVRFRARLCKTSPCQALVNLTSHVYFNLGLKNAFHHELALPTGTRVYPKHFATETEPAQGDEFNYQTLRLISAPLDHCFVFASPIREAVLRNPVTKLEMRVTSTCPAVVVYTAQHVDNRGVCLEFQHPPNSANIDEFRDKITLHSGPRSLAPSTSSMDARTLSASKLPSSSPRRAQIGQGDAYEYDELTMHEFSRT